MTVRVYLPLTVPLLALAREQGSFGPPPLRAHAVTDAVVAALGESEGEVGAEELEYAVLAVAAEESLGMLGPDVPPRRVVAALDVPAVVPVPDGVSEVEVPVEVAWRRLAAVLVDDGAAAPDVAAGRDALAAGRDDDPALERCRDHELGWYAVQEVPDLLR